MQAVDIEALDRDAGHLFGLGGRGFQGVAVIRVPLERHGGDEQAFTVGRGDPDFATELVALAGFTKKNGKKFFGYKAHAGVDEGSGLIRQVIMTSASVHDSKAGDALIQGDEDAVCADKAYDDDARRARLNAAGIKAHILYKARRNKPLRPWQKAFNKVVSAIRAPVERPFAAMKGPYDFGRCRAFGLARNDAHLQLFAGAYNLKTALGLI